MFYKNAQPVILKNQGHEKQGKAEKLTQTREDYRDMTTACNVDTRGIWNRKWAVEGKLVQLRRSLE